MDVGYLEPTARPAACERTMYSRDLPGASKENYIPLQHRPPSMALTLSPHGAQENRSAPEPRSPGKEVGRREPRRQGSHHWGRWTMGHRSFVLFGGNDPAAMLGV
jgi:hypothetical protein